MPRSAYPHDVYLALASVTRRQIIDALSRSDLPVGRLGASLAMTLPAVSQHLKVLRRVGIVTERRVGRMRVYQLRTEPILAMAQWLRSCERIWRARNASIAVRMHEGYDRWA